MAKHRPALLVDGDLILHRCAEAHTVTQCLDPDTGDRWSYVTFVVDAYHDFVDRVIQVRRDVGADEVYIALSMQPNFRAEVLPTYKGNRKATKKPPGFHALKEKVAEHFSVVMKPGLEGDDILGILATHPDLVEAKERIVWSDDKDLRGVPCTLVKTGGIPFTVTTDEADLFHLTQTLSGDVTDGYKGCPGIGEVTATKILNVAPEDRWRAVVTAYEKAGLTEADALVQARVARILRYTDYDFDKGEPILWLPS
jgi:DNA polymerase I